MIREAKSGVHFRGEPEDLADPQLPIPHALCQEELIALSSFFELLASWEIREESNVS